MAYNLQADKWKLFLQYISSGLKLDRSLGIWLAEPHQQWTWFYNPMENAVYNHVDSNTWYKYSNLPTSRLTRHRENQYANPVLSSPPTDYCYPITVTKENHYIYSVPSQSGFPVEYSNSTPQLWDSSETPAPFHNTPYFYQWLIGPTPLTLAQCIDLEEEIKQGSLLSCSDGAYCPITNKGSHSWLFSNNTKQLLASGAGPTDGHPILMSSYRTELGGILTALYIIHRICDYYHTLSGKVTLFCDNKGAVSSSFKQAIPGISPFLSSDYDLIHLAKHLIAITPITVAGEWVKGHYSGNNRKIQHDLNDKADELAGEHLDNQTSGSGTNASQIPIPGYKVRLLKENCVITSKYRSIKWSHSEFNLVHWTAHGAAFGRLSCHQQISIAKLIHNLANTNRNFFYTTIHCHYVQGAPLRKNCLTMSFVVLSHHQ
jgi:hypothetical protein